MKLKVRVMHSSCLLKYMEVQEGYLDCKGNGNEGNGTARHLVQLYEIIVVYDGLGAWPSERGPS